MKYLLKKLYGFLYFKTPLIEILSVQHSLYIHLLFSFNDLKPGIEKQRLRYYLIKHCHIVEKGLALPSPRPGFGKQKIINLILESKKYEQLYGVDDATKILRDMLRAYLIFHHTNNYILPLDFKTLIDDYISEFRNCDKGGLKLINKDSWGGFSLNEYKSFISLRHSVRDFSSIPVDYTTIKEVISASLNTPSVCNRQGWMVHYFSDKAQIKSLLAFQNGNAGFSDCIDKLLIVTCNTKAFTRYEHNQLFIDGGLLSMNIMLALHSAGLGSCPLNTCMPFYRESKLKSYATIPQYEKLIMMIAIGNLKDKFNVAQSEKYSVNEILINH